MKMNKKELLNDLRFILKQYEADLERELYPITDTNTQHDLDEFVHFIESIIQSTTNSLVNRDYSENEYKKLLSDIIKKIDNEIHFNNSDQNKQNTGRQTIIAVTQKIKNAM